MPLLAKETYVYPPDLLDACDEMFDSPWTGHTWWALYTLARNEKVLMRKLAAQERSFYCPVIEKRHRTGRSTVRRSWLPLFSNYVFLRGDETDRYAAVCTGHVSSVLPIHDPRLFIEQMRAIQQLIQAGVPLDVEPSLTVGAYVRIKSGPLKGLRGQIAQLRGGSRFIVNVEFLQKGASTLVDGWELEHLS